MSKFKNRVCRGSYMLGTACGTCERCMEQKENMSAEVKKENGEFIELKVEDFKKLLLCARKCSDDYWIMGRLLQMEPLEESASDCRHRMEFRRPIFNILKEFKDFKI